MDLNTYQRTIKRHAVHRDAYNMPTLPYLLLGLCNEAGEAAGVIKKTYRDAGGRLTPGRRERLIDELGDTLWYLACAARVAGITLDAVARANVAKIKQRKAEAELMNHERISRARSARHRQNTVHPNTSRTRRGKLRNR